MIRDPKMALSGRYCPKCIQIDFISAYYKSLNSLPSETAVVRGRHKTVLLISLKDLLIYFTIDEQGVLNINI
jgi:hypothetical protein